MAYKPVINDVLELKIWSVQGSQAAVNTIHYKVPTAPITGGATDAEIILAMEAFIAPLMKAILANTATYKGCSIQAIYPKPPKVYQYSTAGQGVGTAGAIALPTQASGIAFVQTAKAGPAFRGRVYWPFPAAADNETTGLPTAGYLTREGNLVAALFQDETVVGGTGTTVLRPVIFHRKANKGATTTANGTDDITASGTEKKWATQKKRGIFGRPNVTPF